MDAIDRFPNVDFVHAICVHADKTSNFVDLFEAALAFVPSGIDSVRVRVRMLRSSRAQTSPVALQAEITRALNKAGSCGDYPAARR